MDLGGWSRAINDLTPAECRRLDIARALANRPRVLLLDEPAAGLTDGEQQPWRTIFGASPTAV